MDNCLYALAFGITAQAFCFFTSAVLHGGNLYSSAVIKILTASTIASFASFAVFDASVFAGLWDSVILSFFGLGLVHVTRD